MEILSFPFVVFCLVIVVVYYLLPRRQQNIWLLAASLAFAGTFGAWVALALVISILANFHLGRMLLQNEQPRRWVLRAGVMLNVAALLAFRLLASSYWQVFLDGFARLTHRSGGLTVEVLLPIGFSFYTLQAISYLVDVAHGRLPAAKDLVDFGLYMAYFPRLISGPIERARTFLPLLARKRVIDAYSLARAGCLIVVGVVRKVLIAATLSQYIPDRLFSTPGAFARGDLLIGLLLFGISLYNDFAGYTAIVRGLSILFGIELTPNFSQPYFAHSFSEFWNRWHISLSAWLRDYIFYPLTRSLRRRFGDGQMVFVVALPLLVTMFASGIWHRLGIGMLLWGGLHGAYQAIERLWVLRRPAHNPTGWQNVLSTGFVFLLVMLAWVPFATPGLKQALQFYLALLRVGPAAVLTASKLLWPMLYTLLSFGLDMAQYVGRDDAIFLRWPRLVQAGLLATAILVVFVTLLWRENAMTTFVYQGF